MACDQSVGLQHANARSGDALVDCVLTSEQLFEHFLTVGGWNANASVADFQEPFFAVAPYLHFHVTAAKGIFQRIAHQIVDDGIYLVLVHPYKQFLVCSNKCQTDVFLGSIHFKFFHAFCHVLVQFILADMNARCV